MTHLIEHREENEECLVHIVNKLILLGHSALLVSTFISILPSIYSQLVGRHHLLIQMIRSLSLDASPQIAEALSLIMTSHYTADDNIKDIVNVAGYQLYPNGKSAAMALHKHMLHSNPHILSSLLELDLLVWWADGNDHYLHQPYIHFRADLLAILLACCCPSPPHPKSILRYSQEVGVGIQRRLTSTDNDKKVPTLMWKVLAYKCGVDLNSNKIPKLDHKEGKCEDCLEFGTDYCQLIIKDNQLFEGKLAIQEPAEQEGKYSGEQ